MDHKVLILLWENDGGYVMELQISKEMAILDDSFKYASKKSGFGAELVSPMKHLKGDFIWNFI